MRKIILPASVVASAATAFGLGALVFGNDVPPDAAPLPQATVTATPAPETVLPPAEDDAEPVSATATPGRHARPYTGSETVPTTPTAAPKHAKPTATTKTAAKPATKAAPKPKPKSATAAGSNGPNQDAQGDGKVLDDVVGSLPLPDVGISVPDKLLPFPGPGYTPQTVIATQEDADRAANSPYDAADVVSGPNVVTDPDKPWFNFPTEPVVEAPATPVTEAPVESPTAPVTEAPVRTGGPVSGTRPRFF